MAEDAGAAAPVEKEPQVTGDQHPALHGDVEGEVAKRSADGADGLTYQKVFVMAGEFPHDGDHPQHEANKAGVLQEAINRGLHPKGHPVLVSSDVGEPHRRGQVTTTCTYEVEVVPAVIDDQAETTVTPTDEVRSQGSAA